jgi:hypothetical protein
MEVATLLIRLVRGAVLVTVLASPCAFAERRLALVVGANAGWSSDRPLRYAEEDARRVADVFVELGGVGRSDVTVLFEPTVAQLDAALKGVEAVLRSSAEPTVLFFYYSGHSDAQALHLRGPPMGLASLVERLSSTAATLTVAVFDSCMSGAVLTAKGARTVVPFRIRVEEPVRGLALLSSSDADELSQESRALAGSVFTHHWVSALRGAADVNGDDVVSLSEAYGYAWERTRADTGSTSLPQRPGFRFDLKGQGDVTLTSLAREKAAVDFSVGSGQRYVLVDESERRLVAETISSGQPQRLHVQAGSYKLKRPVAGGIEVASLTLAEGTVVDASRLAYRMQPMELGLVKGGSQFADFAAQGSLARGDAEAALIMFDRALYESPNNVVARRGKARALLLRSSERAKTGEELRDIEQALALDPGLADDPSFNRFERRAAQLREDAQRSAIIRKSTEDELARNPRLRKRWGLGFELLSTKGILVLEGFWTPFSWLSISTAIDLIGPGIDLSVRWIPVSWQWSPYVGVGGHYGFSLFRKSGAVLVNGQPVNLSYDDIWGTMGHVDVGVQWISHGGVAFEFGGGPMLYNFQGSWQAFGFVNLAMGFYF